MNDVIVARIYKCQLFLKSFMRGGKEGFLSGPYPNELM